MKQMPQSKLKASLIENLSPLHSDSIYQKFFFSQQASPQQKSKRGGGSADFHCEEEDVHVKVFYEPGKFVEVKWFSQNQNLTVGWLVSEILRGLMAKAEFNRRVQIIGFKNADSKASECYDFLLTQMEASLSFIRDGDCLSIISNVRAHKSNVGPPERRTLSPSSGQERPHLQLEDFELVKVIGKGGFSKVFQVRRKDTGKIYAMKTLSKQKIKKDNKVENILNEREILERVSHPFIIQMKSAFQNVQLNLISQEDYLFLILEFCAGGELFFRLNNVPSGKMSEAQAQFYFAEILLALEYLHQHDILYRDLKPENIVVDELGHVKLTDFGLSKLRFADRDRAFSFCGSPEYMAPEMLMTEKNRLVGEQPVYHNKSLDFYHLGALLFEILCGLPPFFSEDREKMYRDILFAPINIPSHLSAECRSLLKGLLQKNPSRRLGSKRGAAELKEHPWCAGICWDSVLRKEWSPPFKPFLHKSNFDPEYTQMDPILWEEDPLVALSDSESMQHSDSLVFLGEFENRVQKSKADTRKMVRQHSIELYDGRDNQTFRGYSFLQENPSSSSAVQQHSQQSQQDNEIFFFSIGDSKDDIVSPIFEAEGKQVGPFQGEETSYVSLLSEHKPEEGKEQPALAQQKSKESLYNELLNSFDFSSKKKVCNEKGGQAMKNNNQTQSTMSLFSREGAEVSGKQLHVNSVASDEGAKAEKSIVQKVNKPFLEKIEYNKNFNRKFSPEVDLSGAIHDQMKKQSHKSKFQNRRHPDEHSHPKTNSRQLSQKSEKSSKKATVLSHTDYGSFGKVPPGTTYPKQVSSKRSSDFTGSPENKSNMRGSVKKNSQQKSSQKTNKGVVASSGAPTASLYYSQQSANKGQQTGLTASQFYTQVSKKVSQMGGKGKKEEGKRNRDCLSSNSKREVESLDPSENQTPNQKVHCSQAESEYLLDKDFQFVHTQGMISEHNRLSKTLKQPQNQEDQQNCYVVNKISASEYIGSFMTENSNKQRSGVASKDQSIEERKDEMVAQMILNQSHESCCCSDDEFYSRKNSQGDERASPRKKLLQHIALQESISMNQTKHKENNQQFGRDLQQQFGSPRTKERVDTDVRIRTEKQSIISCEEGGRLGSAHNPSIISFDLPPASQQHHEARKVAAQVSRYVSPSSQQLLLNKTQPISPLRSSVQPKATSKLKERPKPAAMGQKSVVEAGQRPQRETSSQRRLQVEKALQGKTVKKQSLYQIQTQNKCE